ncbi:S10 family serine carboxypeptidase-like protein [Phyllobacterium chamaecytisi]|uniref:S10 family serine carboxypeptidase-like protein n=1 Tax=Phyllobacterium chamaecytisi TaxID=2876082 RepID=UPI001CCD6DE7|nr:hypothetical protein [Phyllobacterium sp. KW56]MBZ9600892.1 hypothetical protein [Phyllobacterium sp. KW56]
MNFRYLLLVPVIALAACDGSDSSSPPAPVVQTSDSTFADAANAQLAALGDKVATLDSQLAESRAKLDQLNGRIGSTDAGIGPVTAKIDALAAQVKGLGETANTASEIISRLSGDGAGNPGDIAKAADDVARLIGDKAEPATIAGAEKRLDDLKTELKNATEGLSSAQGQMALLTGEGTPEKPGIAKLVSLLSVLDSADDSGAIQKARTKLTKLTDDANKIAGILDDAERRLAKLSGDGTEKDLGDIGKALAKLKTVEDAVKAAEDRLAALLGNGTEQNPGTIAKAREELAALTAKSGTLRETIRLQTARAEAVALKAQEKFAEAALAFKDAGMAPDAADMFKAAGMRDEAADMYTRAGMDEEAYKLYAPENYALKDETAYSGEPGASLPAAVDEKPSVMRHNMTLDGKTFWFTASAGHLTAFAKNPEKQEPQASIFYTAYTRDDLPKESRPVTFFFNGGPGASSIYLHLASWAPKHVVIDALKVPDAWAKGRPQAFDFIDSKETLIDRTDLVFVDIVPGTGFSQGIAPNTNQTFWDTSKDVDLSRQFITRYINFNGRQESPKYLYGESYGGGIRVPKLTQALVDAGTSGYERVGTVDKSKFKALTGAVFHSPAFDYSSMDAIDGDFPTYAMVADALGKSSARAKGNSDEAYAEELRGIGAQYSADHKLIAQTYTGLTYRIPSSPLWGADGKVQTDANGRILWDENKLHFKLFMLSLMLGYNFNAYDGRMYVKADWLGVNAMKYNFDFFEEDALSNRIATHLPDYVNYKPKARYINASWQTPDPVADKGPELAFELWTGKTGATGLPNIVAAITRDPSLKLLTVHGYHDTVTPFRRSELDLKGVIIDPATNRTLLDRAPVKNFVGGHMIYYAQESRAPLIKTLDEFYDAPPYGTGPTVAKAQSFSVAAPVQRAPVPAIALH